MANNNKFALDLNKFLSGASKQGTKEVRSVALEGLKGVMRKTPVDEGTARGNWNLDINNIDESTRYDVTSSAKFGSFDMVAFQAGSGVLSGFKNGDIINISNALPYINKLEFTDHSAQGNGMVRRTRSELIAFLKKKNDRV